MIIIIIIIISPQALLTRTMPIHEVSSVREVGCGRPTTREMGPGPPNSIAYMLLYCITLYMFRKCIGSVRFGQLNFPVRRGSACGFLDASWLGSGRFRVRFRPVPESNGSVRFGSAGSVRFLIPSCLTRRNPHS